MGREVQIAQILTKTIRSGILSSDWRNSQLNADTMQNLVQSGGPLLTRPGMPGLSGKHLENPGSAHTGLAGEQRRLALKEYRHKAMGSQPWRPYI